MLAALLLQPQPTPVPPAPAVVPNKGGGGDPGIDDRVYEEAYVYTDEKGVKRILSVSEVVEGLPAEAPTPAPFVDPGVVVYVAPVEAHVMVAPTFGTATAMPATAAVTAFAPEASNVVESVHATAAAPPAGDRPTVHVEHVDVVVTVPDDD